MPTNPPKVPDVNCATFNFFRYFLFSLTLYTTANNAPPIDAFIVFNAALDASFHLPKIQQQKVSTAILGSDTEVGEGAENHIICKGVQQFFN